MIWFQDKSLSLRGEFTGKSRLWRWNHWTGVEWILTMIVSDEMPNYIHDPVDFKWLKFHLQTLRLGGGQVMLLACRCLYNVVDILRGAQTLWESENMSDDFSMDSGFVSIVIFVYTRHDDFFWCMICISQIFGIHQTKITKICPINPWTFLTQPSNQPPRDFSAWWFGPKITSQAPNGSHHREPWWPLGALCPALVAHLRHGNCRLRKDIEIE